MDAGVERRDDGLTSAPGTWDVREICGAKLNREDEEVVTTKPTKYTKIGGKPGSA